MNLSLKNMLENTSKLSIESMDTSLKRLLTINSHLSIDSMDLYGNSSTNSLNNISKPIDIPNYKKKYINNNYHLRDLKHYYMLNLTEKKTNIPCYNCGGLFISQNCSKFCSGECYYSNMFNKYHKFT